MFTLFKNVIKAIVMIAFLIAVVHSAFGGAFYILVAVGANAAAAWLLFYMIAFVTAMITLSQENAFSKKVQKLGKAFWEW